MSVTLAQDFVGATIRSSVAPTLDRDGYAVLRGVAKRSEIAEMREAIAPLLERADVRKRELGERGGAPQIVEVQRIIELAPRLATNGFVQRAQAISAELLGAPVERNFDHIIFKPARNMKETAWHQDAAYSKRLTFTAKRLHWWLPLHDVSEDQSCMRYVPGTHRAQVARHVPVAATSDALRTDLPEGAKVVSCPLNEGDATIHLPNTLHATGPNLTDRSRTAFIVQFSARTFFPRFAR
ncbi:phytanoyl-CoA dioxygenase family protein [Methylovirgula sp. 4M-Z18]|uniref:phytanoyl-CoA dioxygenase family protein n=1 Tax=Methylovirgula sp. 4M-Z18 TaxID=2293567 RepID=UPI001313D95F|nr:phytanoyl-CoA dioxygenase family protein [Methylovirgula sp. 4M-Z18]